VVSLTIELKSQTQMTDPNYLRLAFQQVHQQIQRPMSATHRVRGVAAYLQHREKRGLEVAAMVSQIHCLQAMGSSN
jgi:hypothetical protein